LVGQQKAEDKLRHKNLETWWGGKSWWRVPLGWHHL